MSNRPIKKKKVVEITQEDFDVEWTPPPRTGRDRFIQIGVVFLIVCFLLPAVTCAIPSDEPTDVAQQQAQQTDDVAIAIKNYSDQLAQNPNDVNALANLGYYMTQKAERLLPKEGEEDIIYAVDFNHKKEMYVLFIFSLSLICEGQVLFGMEVPPDFKIFLILLIFHFPIDQ